MATLCKSCGHPLIYDPGVKKMLCSTCGGEIVMPQEPRFPDLSDKGRRLGKSILPTSMM